MPHAAAIPVSPQTGLCVRPLFQNYKDTLQSQVLEAAGNRVGAVKFGADLSERSLSNFQEEQIGQLYELMLESTKPNKQFNIQEDGK